jgi:DNA helicase-2/ATP-dependent DNA helicase PcrA
MSEYGRGANWRDHAVLYRMNAQSNQLEYAFKRNGIPYRVIGGTRFFDRAEVKDILAYLCVIAVPEDELRLLRIINNPPRGIGAKSVESAVELARKNGTTLFDILDRADSFPELNRSAPRMREFTAMIKSLRSFSENNTPDLLLDELLDKSGYLRSLEEKGTDEDTARAENVRELKTSILTFMRESGDRTLAGYLADVALYTDLDNYDKNADSVVMMTIHSAKGLEFPTVFLVGMEETIFPGLRVIGEDEEMEEERRLCYVAITRAKKKLYLVSARQRMIFGRTNVNKVSRFVEEIPSELIDHKNVPKGYDYHERRQSTGFETPMGAKKNPYSFHPAQKMAAPRETPSFKTGDHVRHKAFGAGTITKMTPMGGDFLIEVSFESVGLKKLMLRAAAQHMEKTDG